MQEYSTEPTYRLGDLVLSLETLLLWRTTSSLDDKQEDFLKSELNRLDNEKYFGAVIPAVHYPPYTSGMIHVISSRMLKDIEDAIQNARNFAHYVVLSRHAHN
jgi:hypothetical protein